MILNYSTLSRYSDSPEKDFILNAQRTPGIELTQKFSNF